MTWWTLGDRVVVRGDDITPQSDHFELCNWLIMIIHYHSSIIITSI